MIAWAAIIGPLARVVAMYAAVRALGGGPVVAAGVAAVLAVASPVWESMTSGRVPEEVTPELSVSVALVIALAIRGRHPVRLGLLGGLGTTALLMTHTYDALFAAGLTLAFLVVLRGRFSLRAVVAVAVAAAAIVAIAPFGTAILGANVERIQVLPRNLNHLGASVRYWVLDVNRYVLFGWPAPGSTTDRLHTAPVQIALWLTIVCLLASPLCLLLRPLRWARPWLAVGIFWTGIGIGTSYSGSAASIHLAGLWYGIAQRLRLMIFPVYGVLIVADGCGIGLCLSTLTSAVARRTRPGSGLIRSTAAISALAIVLPLAFGAVPSSQVPVRNALAVRTAQGST